MFSGVDYGIAQIDPVYLHMWWLTDELIERVYRGLVVIDDEQNALIRLK